MSDINLPGLDRKCMFVFKYLFMDINTAMYR